MATFEHSGLFSYKDENKDIHLLYPVTKKDNVEGMDVVEQNVSTAQQTADNALTAANTAKKAVAEIQKGIEDGTIGGGSNGNVIKITFAEGFKGQTFTVSGGGETITGTVPDNLTAEVSVKNCNTQYTVSCSTAGGDAYSTTITTGAYFGQYTTTLNTFTAILNVTAKAGAMVIVERNGQQQKTTANTSGKAAFTLTSAGSYSVYATYDGVQSNTTSVTANTNGQTLTATVNFITLNITVESGSTVVLSKGSFSESYTSVGAATYYLPETGTYTVTAQKNGQTATETVKVTAYTAYSVTLQYFQYWGVKVTKTDGCESAVTYVEDAAGKSAGYASWKDTNLFKNIKPCVLKNGEVQYYLDPTNFTKKADGSAATINSESAGDVMIEFPKLGYKMTTDGNSHTIMVTDDPNAAGYCYRAHSLDTEGDCDKIYIGAYLACNISNKLYSLSGKSPDNNKTLSTFRTAAQARGTGFQLLSFYPLTLLQCLYLIMYKNRNGQAALGRGYVDSNSAATTTGGANAKGMCYGETTGKQQMKFLGLEDFWGNLRQWIDGLFCDSGYNIKTAFKGFNDTGASYPYSKAAGISQNISGWLSDIQGTNEGGFTAKTVSGSATTHWADYSNLSAGYLALFGGHWNNGAHAGPFWLHVHYSASYAYSTLGARLMYKKKKAA